MQDFIYQSAPMRVVFGTGTLRQLPDELSRLGVTRALVLATPRQKDLVAGIREMIGERFAGVFTGAVMHTPVEVTGRAMETVRDLRADCLVAIGGGSTTGLGKAIALRTDLPQIVLPTSYAGSEMTPVVGQTSGGVKTTQSSPKILPEIVIYDVDLTMTMPPGLSATSGINAIAHAVEALYARDRNPGISLMQQEGIRTLAHALPRIGVQPDDRAARTDALYGAWLSGICLGAVGMALHHKLCHTLGGSFNLPHAETHTVILPHALAYNAPATPDAMTRIAAALGVPDPALGLHDLARKLAAPASLREIGMPESGIDQAAEHAVKRADEVPCHRMQPRALRQLIFDVGQHCFEDILHAGVWRRLAEQFRIDVEQTPRVLIGRPPQHHAVDMVEVARSFRNTADTAIDDTGIIGQHRL